MPTPDPQRIADLMQRLLKNRQSTPVATTATTPSWAQEMKQPSSESSVAWVGSLQALAALSLNDPALMIACLSLVEPAEPTRWAEWAIEINAPLAVEVLLDRFGLDPLTAQTPDGEPLFSMTMNAGSSECWSVFERHGVLPTVRWDDPGATNSVFPQGPLNLVSMAVAGSAFDLAHRLLDDPRVAKDQDLLGHALYVITHHRLHYPLVTDSLTGRWPLVQRLVALGADPARVFEGPRRARGGDFQEPVRYLTGHTTLDQTTLGEPVRPGTPLKNFLAVYARRSSMGWSAAHTALSGTLNQSSSNLRRAWLESPQTSEDGWWSLLADHVDWSKLPADAFGRTPLALVLERKRMGEPLKKEAVAEHHDADSDLQWSGQDLLNDLLARGVRLTGATPGWEPLRLAWKNGVEHEQWGPFWALCNHHRVSASPERMSLDSIVGLLEEWSDRWRDHLVQTWASLSLDERQARAMEQNARVRALVQWAPDEVRAALETFVNEVKHDLEPMMKHDRDPFLPESRVGEIDQQHEDRARILTETWVLRLQACLNQSPDSLTAAARPRARL